MKRSKKAQSDTCCCQSGHDRWVHLTFGMLGLIRQSNKPLYDRIIATFEKEWPNGELIGLHPPNNVQEWAKKFYENPKRFIRSGPGRPSISEDPQLGKYFSSLTIYYVCLWSVNDALKESLYDRTTPIEHFDYELVEEAWKAIRVKLPEFYFSRKIPPDTKAIVGILGRQKIKSLPKTIALRLTAHICGCPEKEMAETLTKARRKYPDRVDLYKKSPPCFRASK